MMLLRRSVFQAPLRRYIVGIFLVSAMGLGGLVSTASAEPRTFVIDPDHFSVGFLIEHLGYNKVLGMFLEGEGEFVYDEQTRVLSSGTVTIAADSVFSNHEARDEHLREDDFLDAEEHPEISFVVTGFEPGSQHEGEVTGDLTLLGETRPVTLDVTLNKTADYPFGHEDYVLGASARTTIKRSDWGMTYGVADDLVGDEVELILEFEAIRQ